MLRPELLICQQFASSKSPGTDSVNLLCRAHASSGSPLKTGEGTGGGLRTGRRGPKHQKQSCCQTEGATETFHRHQTKDLRVKKTLRLALG